MFFFSTLVICLMAFEIVYSWAKAKLLKEISSLRLQKNWEIYAKLKPLAKLMKKIL